MWLKRAGRFFIAVFFILNIIAAFHAYKFTHFSNSSNLKTRVVHKLSMLQKAEIIFFGISNPRPENAVVPKSNYTTVYLKSDRKIECWHIKTKNAKGVIVLFHGYGGNKASLLDKAEIFNQLGYDTFLVDFMGSGGSEGNQTSIGFFESCQVKTCYEYLKAKGEKNVYLFGTSMGAAAIMKAVSENEINARAIIIECPFGTMYETVCARFNMMHVPATPMAPLLVFWGGVINGFWAFGHNPATYAKNINLPVLLLYGAKDEKVSSIETATIFNNLKGEKSLKIYSQAGHENYLIKYKNEWTRDVQQFLEYNSK